MNKGIYINNLIIDKGDKLMYRKIASIVLFLLFISLLIVGCGSKLSKNNDVNSYSA
jgi:hypothetical protein